ncbi:PGG domain [Dillenia turbinata]|uniref:PGG domain n=1 Tax=Dillenia turbinata TaxID=194707 RepID=A0AAN8UP90_9MAGN
MSAAQTNSQEPHPAEPRPPADHYDDWFRYYRFDIRRDSPNDARNVLLVVAALIAAATFQAGLNPPGGAWQDEAADGSHEAGKSIFGSHKVLYTVFIFCNTLAFSSSVNIITYLAVGCPFSEEVLLAVYSMLVTYGASIAAVQPKRSVSEKFVFIPLFLPLALRIAQQLLKKWFGISLSPQRLLQAIS